MSGASYYEFTYAGRTPLLTRCWLAHGAALSTTDRQAEAGRQIPRRNEVSGALEGSRVERNDRLAVHLAVGPATCQCDDGRHGEVARYLKNPQP